MLRTVNSTGDWSAITQEPMIAKGPMLSSCKYSRKHKVVRKSFGAIYGLSLKQNTQSSLYTGILNCTSAYRLSLELFRRIQPRLCFLLLFYCLSRLQGQTL